LAEQAAPRRVRQSHATELVPINVGNTVVFGETLVDEGVVGPQKVDHATIFMDDVADEQICLFQQCLAEVVVEIGEDLLIGHGGFQVS